MRAVVTSATQQLETRARWQMHVCVLLWGFTAILGKSISLAAPALVLWRMSLVGVALLTVPRVRRGVGALSAHATWVYAGIGCVLALHWVTFYASIKLANASVAVTCIALGPSFLAVLSPLLSKQGFDPRELLLGVIVIPGVALVVGAVPRGMQLGIALGVISALLVAMVGLLNKRYVDRADPLVMTCVEMIAGAITMALLAAALGERQAFRWPDAHDAMLLAVLAYGCTLLPFSLSLIALRRLSAFSAQLIVNLEPVYTILLAMLFFGEQRELDRGFYLGVALILAAVVASRSRPARAVDRG
jgi:drug/metabolite transporter (DMT)-like permease